MKQDPVKRCYLCRVKIKDGDINAGPTLFVGPCGACTDMPLPTPEELANKCRFSENRNEWVYGWCGETVSATLMASRLAWNLQRLGAV